MCHVGYGATSGLGETVFDSSLVRANNHNSFNLDFGLNFGMDKNFSGHFLQILTLEDSDAGEQDDLQVQTWGTPWEPDEFVAMAVRAGHPSTMQSFLPPLLARCIDRIAQMAVHARVMHRASAVKHWLRRSLELRQDEKTLVAGLQPTVAEVLQGKKLLLWKEMLQSINYSDTRVCQEFFNGTHLTGQTERTGLWPSKITPATMTESDLLEQAKLQRSSLTYEQVVFFDEDIPKQSGHRHLKRWPRVKRRALQLGLNTS